MSFYTSLNGLKNSQTDLGVIAHNIADLHYALDAGIESACPTIIHAPIQTGGPTELTGG